MTKLVSCQRCFRLFELHADCVVCALVDVAQAARVQTEKAVRQASQDISRLALTEARRWRRASLTASGKWLDICRFNEKRAKDIAREYKK